METLIGKDYLQERIGFGISDNLKLAFKEALTNFGETKYISVNIIGPEGMMLSEIQEPLYELRESYDVVYSLSISKELNHKYVVFVLNGNENI